MMALRVGLITFPGHVIYITSWRWSLSLSLSPPSLTIKTPRETTGKAHHCLSLLYQHFVRMELIIRARGGRESEFHITPEPFVLTSRVYRASHVKTYLLRYPEYILTTYRTGTRWAYS